MVPLEVVRVSLPTPYGTFDVRAFECSSGSVYLALVRGSIEAGGSILARVHSECLTGDALASLRCDCGVQLRTALKAIAAEGRGVLVYATGHEGRGIGLVSKLRAYVEQDDGADTVDANLHLGFPIDGRDYADAAAVLASLGVRSVRLLTNNPDKVHALEAAGIRVEEVRGLPTAAHARNLRYLTTKQTRMSHLRPIGDSLAEVKGLERMDVGALIGDVRKCPARPYVALKFAQSLDGRIATRNGDSKWITGEGERAVSHALRAACDAVMVGVGTVVSDDPRLTVRLVPGASPLRVVLDSTLRIPLHASIVTDEALTIVLTTARSDPRKRAALAELDVGVRVLGSDRGRVDIREALQTLELEMGIESLLVEGGAETITSLLSARVVDRLIVGIAPLLLGRGTESVGELGVGRVVEGVHLTDRSVHLVGEDVLLAANVAATRARAALPGSGGVRDEMTSRTG